MAQEILKKAPRELLDPKFYDELRSLPTTKVASRLFEVMAPSMGWSWPTGRTVFRPTTGTGNDIKPKPDRTTSPMVVINGKSYVAGDPQASSGKHVPIIKTWPKSIPTLPGSVEFTVNGQPLWMTLGVAGAKAKDKDGVLRDTMQNIPAIKPIRAKTGNIGAKPTFTDLNNMVMDGCIVVEQSERDKFAFLMLCPSCSMSPFQMSPEERNRMGIDFRLAGRQDVVPLAHMTPDNIDTRQDEQDRQDKWSAKVSATLIGMGVNELSGLVPLVGVSVRGNAANMKDALIAAFIRVIEGRNNSPKERQRYEILKKEVLGEGDLSSSIDIITQAVKFGILRHDGSRWYHNDKFVYFSIMDDESSGHVAQPGAETQWLATKVVSEGLEEWIDAIHAEVLKAQEEVANFHGGDDSLHAILDAAIHEGIIIGYDKERKTPDGKPDKTYRWWDGDLVCDNNMWGSSKNRESSKKMLLELKGFFTSTPIEAVRDMIDAKREKRAESRR